MKLQKLRRILASALICSMLAAGSAGAADTVSADAPGQGILVREVPQREEPDAEVQEETPKAEAQGEAPETGTAQEKPQGDSRREIQGGEEQKETQEAEKQGEAQKKIREAEAQEETPGAGLLEETQGEAPEAESQEEAQKDTPGAEAQEEAAPDARTQALLEEYNKLLNGIRTCAIGTYESELAKFPASYRPYLEELHKAHPEWIFVAMNRNLSWNDIVKAESVSGSSKGTNQSLLPKTSAGILLSKASTDYNAKTGSYIAKDGQTWVSASYPAVAYNVDPRNFLTDSFIFMFEALEFNGSYHTLQSVENVLKGTDLSNRSISYINTAGKTVSVPMKYGEAIYAAGEKNSVSPLFLAAKIRQETGAKLSNGSLSGNYSYAGTSYRGYYNYYNIGAYSTSTGSAVANGLAYAKKNSWTSPVLAIDGGAQFLAASYIKRGQNTIYFQKFNTAVSPYYQHQYMQNLTAAASEAKTTYNSYSGIGILNDAYVFYVPVYNNMPSQDSPISISKSVTTGKTTSAVTLRSGPSAGASAVTTVPKGKSVTVSGAVHADIGDSVSSQEANPYWYKVTYGSATGYLSYKYVDMDAGIAVKAGAEKQLSVTGPAQGEKIYYETSDPAVATVSSSGAVTGVSTGECDIYAVTGSGKKMDAVGVSVNGKVSSKKVKLTKPKLVSASNAKSGVTVKWKAVPGAKGYYIYRKLSGQKSFKKIKTISSGSTVKYTDKTAKGGKKYVYTVKAYKGSKKSSYNKTGLTIRRLTNPVLKSVSGKKNGIKIKWKKVKCAVEYEVYRKSEGGKFKKIARLEKRNAVSYTDKTAQPGVTYCYTVKACSGIYKSAYNKTGITGSRK